MESAYLPQIAKADGFIQCNLQVANFYSNEWGRVIGLLDNLHSLAILEGAGDIFNLPDDHLFCLCCVHYSVELLSIDGTGLGKVGGISVYNEDIGSVGPGKRSMQR